MSVSNERFKFHLDCVQLRQRLSEFILWHFCSHLWNSSELRGGLKTIANWTVRGEQLTSSILFFCHRDENYSHFFFRVNNFVWLFARSIARPYFLFEMMISSACRTSQHSIYDASNSTLIKIRKIQRREKRGDSLNKEKILINW